MNEKIDFALVPRPPDALEKAEPGPKRILSGMVADTLALAKKELSRKSRPLRIVSVDDEEGRLELVEVIISGFFKYVTLQSFLDAEEAWQELSRTDPHLLITDDLMGKLTGEEIVRRLADGKVPYPIIVINGYGPERDQWVLDCVKRGVNVTLLRAPYSCESFVRALESALRISRDATGPVEVVPHRRRIRPPRIVILDDEPNVCDAIRLMLQIQLPNAEILTFTNVEAALEELEREDPDLFTTDWNHYGMRGPELLQTLAARKVKYPVFVISAFAPEDVLLYAGPDLNVTLLRKPFTMEQLRALLLKHLGPSKNPRRQILKDTP